MYKRKYLKYKKKYENLKKFQQGGHVLFLHIKGDPQSHIHINCDIINTVKVNSIDIRTIKHITSYYVPIPEHIMKSIPAFDADINNIPQVSYNIEFNDGTREMFYISRYLGSGAFGVVCEYKNKKDETVAIKTILKKMPNIIKAFQDEITIVKNIINSGCNLVNANVFLVNGEQIIVMESESTNLAYIKEVIQHQNTETQMYIILTLLWYIIDCFECLYKLGYIYYDFKNSNLLLNCKTNGNKLDVYFTFGDLGSIERINVIDDKNKSKESLIIELYNIVLLLVSEDIRQRIKGQCININKFMNNILINRHDEVTLDDLLKFKSEIFKDRNVLPEINNTISVKS